MKRILLSLLIISAAIINTKAQNKIQISTSDFSSFEINQPLDVYIHQADSSYIELKGNNVNADKVHINNKEGHLVIQLSGAANMNAVIHIYTKDYKGIQLRSSSDLHTIGQIKGDELFVETSSASDCNLNLDYNHLIAKVSGASDLSIYGRAEVLDLEISGASDFDSYGAKNTTTRLHAVGSSDVNVNPDSSLIADLSGASELRYKNEPAHKSINSTGASEYSQKSNTGDTVSFNNMGVYENGDTVRIDLGNGKRQLVIVDGNDGVKIKTHRGNRAQFRGNWAGVELGVNGYMTPNGEINMPTGYEFLELKYENSRNFNLNFFQQSFNIAGNKFGFLTGLGFRWLNYRFANDVVLSGDSSTVYGYHDVDPTRSYTKSKLTAWYLTMPLLFEYQTNSHHLSNSFHIAVGVIGGLRLGSHSKHVFTTTGGGKQKNRDAFHLQPFVLDATARVGWGPINLFATYSLIDMFRQDRGPELRPFTVGIILPFT